MTPRLGGYLLIAPPVMLLAGAALYKADAPFGWVHVLVVYLLATFPLSALLADWIAARVNLHWLPMAAGVLGLALVLATWIAGRYLTEWLGWHPADLFVLQGTVGLWCLLLQLPLCLCGRWVVNRVARDEPALAPSWVAILLALFVAASGISMGARERCRADGRSRLARLTGVL